MSTVTPTDKPKLRVLVFMGDLGQDPTEVAIPVHILKEYGESRMIPHIISFFAALQA